MKLTDAQWKAVKVHLPEELADQIELDHYISSMKGETGTFEVLRANGEAVEQLGEKLSEYYFLSLPIDSRPNDKRRILNHISGYMIASCISRKSALRLYAKIKNLDIQHEIEGLKASKDFQEFVKIVRGHELGAAK